MTTQQATAPTFPTHAIERQPVVSGNLKSVGFDAATSTMDVEFSSGRVYRFLNVPPTVHKDLIGAESVGSFFARNVRGKFPSADLDTLDMHEGSTAD